MLLLEGLDSPFEHLQQPGLSLTAGDLLLALRVCARARFPFRHVDVRPTWRDRLATWWLHRSPERLAHALTLFIRWRRECSLRPEFWQDEGDVTGGGLTAPHQLARAVKLLRVTNLSEERIWTMSVGALAWYDGAVDEQESTIRKFAYDSDLDAAAELPDLNTMTEDELYAVAEKDLGPEIAAIWRANRQKSAPPDL